MLIFARCLHSSAAVTPVKYEYDIIQVISVLIILKNWENNKTERNWFSNPHPMMLQDIEESVSLIHCTLMAISQWKAMFNYTE